MTVDLSIRPSLRSGKPLLTEKCLSLQCAVEIGVSENLFRLDFRIAQLRQGSRQEIWFGAIGN